MIGRIKSNLPTRSKPGRADRGLYHGKEKLHGNQISYSHIKTRRNWDPNVQSKAFYSDLLDQKLKINVTTKAIRCIDKMGSLDNYILYSKPKNVSSQLANDLRKVMTERWEYLNKRPFDRRLILHENKLHRLAHAGKITADEGNRLIKVAYEHSARVKKFLKNNPGAELIKPIVIESPAAAAAAPVTPSPADSVKAQAAL